MRFIIITGLSGSGKTTAAQVLEDDGYYVVDNFPTVVLEQFLVADGLEKLGRSGIAIVVDARNPAFLNDAAEVFAAVAEAGHEVEIFFFDAGDDALIRRYSTTRRRHPLTSYSDIAAAIARERVLLQPLRARADVIFDTSEMSVHQLKVSVLLRLHGSGEQRLPMFVRLQSFGFCYGVPLESDLVIDVRFLPNPHYIEALRPLSGCDKAVSAYVLGQPLCQEFLRHTCSWLNFMLPQYRREGKSYLTISVGCTGGHHRSVAVVEEMSRHIDGVQDIKVVHRDLVRES